MATWTPIQMLPGLYQLGEIGQQMAYFALCVCVCVYVRVCV